VSYGYYRAFNSMLDNILLLRDVSNKVAKGKRYKEIKKGTGFDPTIIFL
jgi:hypothetical protein